MPLLPGKENVGANIKTEEKTHPKRQAVAIALHEAGVPKKGDTQAPMATTPNSGIPLGRRDERNVSRSANDHWKGKSW